MPKPTLAEIARRIDAHLKRFERDPVINARWTDGARKGLTPYYHAWASAGGSWISVQYVSYQGSRALRRNEAERYLAWLNAGNVGRHWEALR